MKKHFFRSTCCASGMLFAAGSLFWNPTEALSCGPYFPPSYFDEQYGILGHNIALDPVRELQMLGALYYPNWVNRKIVGNSIKSDEGDAMDFLLAAQRAKLEEQAGTQALERYREFCNTLYLRMLQGEAVTPPEGVERCFLEFYWYKIGHTAYRINPTDSAPDAWKTLLALPEDERHYRTTRVLACQVMYAANFAETDLALERFRQALDAGFADTIAMEESVLRQLVRRNGAWGIRYLPLLFVTQKVTDDREHPYRTFYDDFQLYCQSDLKATDPEVFAALLQDPLGRELLLLMQPRYIRSMMNWENGTFSFPESRLFTADRIAWQVFRDGDWDLGRQLLTAAPENSMIKLYLEARLDRAQGNLAGSAEKLRKFLHLYAQGSPLPEDFVRRDFLMEAGFFRYGVSPAEQISGEFGATLLQQNNYYTVEEDDLLEALHALIQSQSVLDAAWVAERLLTTEQLLRYEQSAGEPQSDCARTVRDLLARRLMREGRVLEAEAFFAAETRPFYQQYCALSREANDATRSKEEQSLALFNLAKLISAQGMELFGTELEPDCKINAGSYPNSGFPYGEIPSWNLPQNKISQLNERFHYRTRAADFAIRSAMQTSNPTLRSAALLLGGMIYRGRSPLHEDLFYKLLCQQDSEVGAQAREQKWFPQDLQKNFLAAAKQPQSLTLEEVGALLQATTVHAPSEP